MNGVTVGNFAQGMRVCYVPLHARAEVANGSGTRYAPLKDSLGHPDCEWGMVSRVTDRAVFVKFDAAVRRMGWDNATPQGCDPGDLYISRIEAGALD